MNVRLCLRVYMFSVLLRSPIEQPCKFIAWRDQAFGHSQSMLCIKIQYTLAAYHSGGIYTE